MARYNREWLDGVHRTERLIEVVSKSIDDVPFPHRPVVARHFEVAVGNFRLGQAEGLDTELPQDDILALSRLVNELIKEGEKQCVVYSLLDGATSRT